MSDRPAAPEGPRRAWTGFAHRTDNGWVHVWLSERTTRMHNPSAEVVPVELFEDPSGGYLGWLAAGRDDVALVQRERLFAMQFPYGPDAEEQRGTGRVVRLRIEVALGGMDAVVHAPEDGTY